MKKIAIIEPVGGHGGNDVYGFNLVRSINKHECCRATLYTCDETDIQGVDGVKLTYKNIYGKANKYIRAFNYILGTLRSLVDAKKHRVEIVHLHYFEFSGLEYFNLYMAKKIFGFFVVGTVHDVECFQKYARGDSSSHDYDKFLSLLDGVVVHTEYARKELLEHVKLNVMDVEKIKTIYACDLDYENMDTNGIDTCEARRYLGLPDERKVILFFGQVKKVKGLDVLLEALSIVVKKDPSVLLVIAGKARNDDFEEYNNIIQTNNLESYVELRIEFVENKDVPYYFNASELVVLPYKKIYNSGVLIRAMSFGAPVVASNFGPFKEFISDGVNGFLFETGNAQNLAKKIVTVLNWRTPLSDVGLAEKEFIARYFSLQELGRQYNDIYQMVLEVK